MYIAGQEIKTLGVGGYVYCRVSDEVTPLSLNPMWAVSDTRKPILINTFSIEDVGSDPAVEALMDL